MNKNKITKKNINTENNNAFDEVLTLDEVVKALTGQNKKEKSVRTRKLKRKARLKRRKANKMAEMKQKSINGVKELLNNIYEGNPIKEKQSVCDIQLKNVTDYLKKLSKNERYLKKKYREYLSNHSLNDIKKLSFDEFKHYIDSLYKDSINLLKNCRVDIDNISNTIIYQNVKNVIKECKKYEKYFGGAYLEKDFCFLEYIKRRAFIGYVIDTFERFDGNDSVGVLTYDFSGAVIACAMNPFYWKLCQTETNFNDIDMLEKDFEFIYSIITYSNLLYYLNKSEQYLKNKKKMKYECLETYRVDIYREEF